MLGTKTSSDVRSIDAGTSGPALNIVHVLGSFEVGGAERVALALATEQRAQGHRVAVIALSPGPEGPLARVFSERGVSTRTIAKRPGFDVRLTAKLAAHFVRERVDVVHVHNPQPLIYGSLAGRVAKAAVIYTKHGTNSDSKRRVLLRRAAALLVDAYVAVSQPTADVARGDREVGAKKLYVIMNGIDGSEFAPVPSDREAVRRELGLPLDEPVIGSVSRLSSPKSHDVLLRAAAPLLTAPTSARLLFVGDGPDRGELERLAASLGIGDRVVFAGNRGDIPRVLNALDIFVLSSRSEGLPLAIIEAMATQLPVVASNVGGISSVITHGRTGLLVPSGDDLALRDALRGLLSDEEHARALGRRARASALARFSSVEMSNECLRLYFSVMRRRGSEPIRRAASFLAVGS